MTIGFVPSSSSGRWQLPVVCGTPEEYVELLEMQGCFGFSCNRYHEVWSADHAGFHAPEDRNQLEGASRVLDAIVELVLDRAWLGARFYIEGRTVFTSETDEPVALLAVEDR